MRFVFELTELYQCQFPGLIIALWLCKMLSLGKGYTGTLYTVFAMSMNLKFF